MKLIKLPYSPSVKNVRQIKFGGLDRTPGASEGAIRDMKNVTSSAYPVITRRPPRSVFSAECAGADDAIFGTDGTLYHIKSGKFYVDGDAVGTTSGKKMCLLGNNYVVVSEPGFTIYNKTTGAFASTNATKYLTVQENVTPASTTVTETITIETDVSEPGVSAGTLTITAAGSGTSTLSSLADSISQYGADAIIYNDQYYSVSNVTYANDVLTADVANAFAIGYNSGDEIGFALGQGHGTVTIAPASTTSTTPAVYNVKINTTANKSVVSAEDASYNDTVQGYYDTLTGYTGNSYLLKVGTAETTISSVSIATTNSKKKVTINFGSSITVSNSHAKMEVWSAATAVVPDLSNVFQHGNRLWGTNGNTIYASKLGDPYNWYTYDGLSTDSWALTVASPGEFSAGFSYGGYPRFFKERTVLTVYGRLPDEFYTDEDEVLGVQSGSERSVCVIGGYVYYVSEQGVCRWSGGASTEIISRVIYDYVSSGAGGTDGRKYYLSCLIGGERSLIVYDSLLGMWHKEDGLNASKIFSYERALYALTSAGLICLSGVDGGSETYDAYVEFADVHLKTDEDKTVQKFTVRAEVAEGATMYVYVSYDGGEYISAGVINAGSHRLFEIPIIPRRCERMRLRIECDGDFTIYSVNHYYLS